jgi:hypothetical protein
VSGANYGQICRRAYPRSSLDNSRILAVGTAVPVTAFDQQTVVGLFGYSDAVHRNFAAVPGKGDEVGCGRNEPWV